MEPAYPTFFFFAFGGAFATKAPPTRVLLFNNATDGGERFPPIFSSSKFRLVTTSTFSVHLAAKVLIALRGLGRKAISIAVLALKPTRDPIVRWRILDLAGAVADVPSLEVHKYMGAV